MSSASPIPKGFHSVTVAMTIKDAAKAVEFYKEAFGAEEVLILRGPGGAVVHGEIRIGDSLIMLGEEWPGHHVQSPTTRGGTTCSVHLYVSDVDAAHARAVSAGAQEVMPPTEMFWGDRFSSLTDPYGHAWSLATHVKDVTPEECQAACDEFMARAAGGGEGGG